MSRRILFVHDDPSVLEALAQALGPARARWHIESSRGLPEALERLETAAFDVVAVDLGRAGAGSRSVLDEIAARQPKAIRVVIADSGARGVLLRAGGDAHVQVSRPTDLEAVFAQLESTLALGEVMADARLTSVIGRLRSVPSLPTVYLAIMAEMRQEEPSGERIGELVAKDAGMSAKLLQLVNSPYFGVRMAVSAPSHAVQLLGLETVRALVLSMHIFEQFDERSMLRFRLGRVWRHSLASAHCARLVARLSEGKAEATGEVMTAALLHDIGKLVLARALGDEYGQALAQAEKDRLPQCEAERELFGTTHAEVGAYLLGLWGLPESIVWTAAWHHRPSACPSSAFSPLGVVHVSDAIEHEVHPAELSGAPPVLDAEYMERMRAAWHYAAWKAAYLDAEGEGLGRGRAARL